MTRSTMTNYCHGMTKVTTEGLPPALRDLRSKEKAWAAEAREWLKETVPKYLSTEEPKTCGEILADMDADPTMPTGYAMLVRSEKVAYNKRYLMLRHVLETLARARVVWIGTTINTRGNERSSTYTLAKDASEQWKVDVSAKPNVKNSIEEDLRAFLAEKGYTPSDIAEIKLTPRGTTNVNHAQAKAPGATRLPRTKRSRTS